MAADQDSKSRKQHDLEETPRAKAQRLLKNDMRLLTDRFAKLRARLYHHARYLSVENKVEILEFLNSEMEQTRTILDGVSGPREFGFADELLDSIDIESHD